MQAVLVKERKYVAAVPLALERAEAQLSFKPELIGQISAIVPTAPTVIGPWLIQPILEPADLGLLPKRARRRLQQVLAIGIKPKDVLIYHELSKPSWWQPHAQNLTLWVSQDLPVHLDETRRWLHQHGPTIMRVVVTAMFAVLALVGALILFAIRVVAATDPVLVITVCDERGGPDLWWELDRWFS